jgi:hypothetical protein
MPEITKPPVREIIEDFAKEIRERRMETAKPSRTVINFRTDIQDGIERTIWRVPIDLLRYRKDNGRISSDILDYERNVGFLDEKDDQTQAIIANFLEKKDPEKTSILRSNILHAGQLEPAIVTCDGFLINGNRRKMVMDRLHKEYPENENFAYMKAVILPGKDEEGGPPTLLEVEKIENRYQLQSEGKSEYYGFDRALSIKRKIELGFKLEEQLRDDPRFVEATKSQLEKAVRDYKMQYLEPLDCIDRYLKQFRREGQYRAISAGMSDPEGRWQAFIDYANCYSRYFSNAKNRIMHGIEEDEVGSIEEAAFNIIRLRAIPDMPKVHAIMRDLPKYCSTKEGKLELLKIAEEVEPVLPRNECLNEHGNSLSPEEVDAKWAAASKKSIIYHIKRARNIHEAKKEKETPIDLLDAAYKKLTHENMDVNAIDVADYGKARKLAENIKDRADSLKSEIFLLEKNSKKLAHKKKP